MAIDYSNLPSVYKFLYMKIAFKKSEKSVWNVSLISDSWEVSVYLLTTTYQQDAREVIWMEKLLSKSFAARVVKKTLFLWIWGILSSVSKKKQCTTKWITEKTNLLMRTVSNTTFMEISNITALGVVQEEFWLMGFARKIATNPENSLFTNNGLLCTMWQVISKMMPFKCNTWIYVRKLSQIAQLLH